MISLRAGARWSAGAHWHKHNGAVSRAAKPRDEKAAFSQANFDSIFCQVRKSKRLENHAGIEVITYILLLITLIG